MSADGTLPGGRDPGGRLLQLLEAIEQLPGTPPSEGSSQQRLDLIAEVEAIVRARRESRKD